ncbi:MAG: HAD-IIIC family phosphatase [Kiritimatiellae bacterium]|nr:HAD-IIIC family phosphatase [Kiritimatiellia bacterium]
MKVALAGDVALDLLAPYFREAGFETYVPAGFGTWRQELLDGNSGLHRFSPDAVCDVRSYDGVLAREIPGFFDERMRVLASMPYSLAGIRAIVDEFSWSVLSSSRKILAVDADETLWRGILSEDGKENLSPCTSFQEGLKALRAEGVTLVLLTKNDPVFPFMRGDMPLKDGDFAVMKVNWGPKAGNLLEACRELNLGVESAVFLDDNPFERAQMKAQLPEVATAPWNGWDGGCPAVTLLRRLKSCFFSGMGATAEDRLRSADYSAMAARAESLAGAKTLEGYLDSLDLRVEPSAAGERDLDRLAQMAGKTNQFNATTIRRSRACFASLIADPSKRVFVFRSRDRYGDQGLVCYVVADLPSRRITDFVMSCRAMGRTLEHFAWRYVCDALGFVPSVDFVPTAKNGPFKAFLDSGMAVRTRYRT